jgi:hypothetical protein
VVHGVGRVLTRDGDAAIKNKFSHERRRLAILDAVSRTLRLYETAPDRSSAVPLI